MDSYQCFTPGFLYFLPVEVNLYIHEGLDIESHTKTANPIMCVQGDNTSIVYLNNCNRQCMRALLYEPRNTYTL